jgi:hypothetical protein
MTWRSRYSSRQTVSQLNVLRVQRPFNQNRRTTLRSASAATLADQIAIIQTSRFQSGTALPI